MLDWSRCDWFTSIEEALEGGREGGKRGGGMEGGREGGRGGKEEGGRGRMEGGREGEDGGEIWESPAVPNFNLQPSPPPLPTEHSTLSILHSPETLQANGDQRRLGQCRHHSGSQSFYLLKNVEWTGWQLQQQNSSRSQQVTASSATP